MNQAAMRIDGAPLPEAAGKTFRVIVGLGRAIDFVAPRD
jgi:hypothetical protein